MWYKQGVGGGQAQLHRVPSPHLAVAGVGRQSPLAATCAGDTSPPRVCSAPRMAAPQGPRCSQSPWICRKLPRASEQIPQCWCHQWPSQLTSALGEADGRIKGNFPFQCPQKDIIVFIPCVILLAWLCGVKLGLWFSYGSLQASVWLCCSVLRSTKGAETV